MTELQCVTEVHGNVRAYASCRMQVVFGLTYCFKSTHGIVRLLLCFYFCPCDYFNKAQ